jgi:hypothetical protein
VPDLVGLEVMLDAVETKPHDALFVMALDD